MSDQPLNNSDEYTPVGEDELSARLRDNSVGLKRPVCAGGGRTSMRIGYPLNDDEMEFLSLRAMDRVLEYPSRDMTITVQAGMRIEPLQQLLAVENQQLPVDLPCPARSTIGGAIATNWSGSRRFGYGTLRDYLIGVTAVDAGGRVFNAGGRVVKNVAGYDLCKLLVGSLGTLGVISQVTLKLKPQPIDSAVLWCSFSCFEAVDRVFERLVSSQARPVSLDVYNEKAVNQITTKLVNDVASAECILAIGVEGTSEDVQWQLDVLRTEIGVYNPTAMDSLDAELTRQLYQAVCDFGRATVSPLALKAGVLPSGVVAFVRKATSDGLSVIAHAADGIVLGQLPDDAATLKQAEAIVLPLREMAQKGRGYLFLVHCEDEWKRQLTLTNESHSSFPLMQKIKQQLDPENLLSPGRLIDGPLPV
jgi:glycolate oxidase FAD binding subunit